MTLTPAFSYRLGTSDQAVSWLQADNARELEIHGRTGVHLPSHEGRIVIPEHNLNNESGMLSLWFCSLDELASFMTHPHHTRHHPFPNVVPLLGDHKNHADSQKTRFALHWHAEWHISLYAKFYRGSVYPGAFFPELKALSISVHNHLRADRWYHLVMAWDRPNNRCDLYLNGVRVAAANRLADDLSWEECGPELYAGHPRLVLGDLHFYNECLTREELDIWAQEESAETDREEFKELQHLQMGVGNPTLDVPEEIKWETVLEDSLNTEKSLDLFAVQGCVDSVSITEEGLQVKTPWVKPVCLKIPDGDMKQVYLWTRTFFEGDIHISFEFKSLRPGGLALLVAQAAGMQRESFLEEYEPREGGEMSFIVDEDIRNYHWEFYREMIDVRNDVSTQGIIKNPWHHPLGQGVYGPGIDIGTWYRLDFIQTGGRLIGAINGEQVWETQDDVRHGCGPILRAGHIGLRAMIRTEIVFRNLTVRQPRYHTVKPLQQST